MKLRNASYIAASLCWLATAGALAAEDRSPAIDREIARAAFDEARTLDASNPWPARLYGPLLLADPRSREVVANQADAEGLLRAEGGLFVGTLPADVGIANTALTWSGVRWTMLRWPLPEGHFARRRLIGHELFHRLGPEIGLPMSNPANAHLDRFEGRLWLRAELRALVRALASEGDARRGAVVDALVFRGHRQAVFPEAAREERLLERNEGLAEYTGICTALPEAARIGWAVQRAESFEVGAGGSSVARSFAYATGPLYGLLLDAAMPGWQRHLGDEVDLGALLMRALDVDLGARSAAMAQERLGDYDGARLEAFERARETERLAAQRAARARYVDGPVLTLPVDEAFGYTFDPGDVGILEGEGQILATATVRGGWGTLEVTDGVLLRREGANVTGVVVPSPEDAAVRPLVGDGWRLQLADGWRLTPGPRPGDWIVRRLERP